MRNPEEVMEILEAFDLAGTLRGAAELAGCDHKTVAHGCALARRLVAGCGRGQAAAAGRSVRRGHAGPRRTLRTATAAAAPGVGEHEVT